MTQSNNLSKAERHDGQVVTPHSKDRDSQKGTTACRKRHANRKHQPERDVEIELRRGHEGVTVCSDGIKSDIAKVEEPGKPHHDVQAKPQDDVDPNITEDLCPVIAHKRREGQKKDHQRSDIDLLREPHPFPYVF
jgi:hypothetical protein